MTSLRKKYSHCPLCKVELIRVGDEKQCPVCQAFFDDRVWKEIEKYIQQGKSLVDAFSLASGRSRRRLFNSLSARQLLRIYKKEGAK